MSQGGGRVRTRGPPPGFATVVRSLNKTQKKFNKTRFYNHKYILSIRLGSIVKMHSILVLCRQNF